MVTRASERASDSPAPGSLTKRKHAATTTGGQPVPSYTLDQVGLHNSPGDCWVIVRRKVYDVTAWVPKHPGGSLIYIKAGHDCTQLFDSYHPLSARLVLDKFYIGDLEVLPGQEGRLVEYEEAPAPGGRDFYTVLRQRVDKYFRENKIHPRASVSMVVKTGAILALLVGSYYGAFFAPLGFPAALVCAVLLGVAFAEVGVSIQHDANHGAYSSSWFGQVMCASLDFIGASSFMWKQQHVVGHHCYTNVETADPDIRVSDPDVRRVTHRQPWQPYQAWQQWYLAALYGLLGLKSILLDDFSALRSGSIGPVKLARQTRREAAVFWAGKALFAAYFVLLPALRSGRSWPALAALWLLSELVAGWLLAFMFQVAHVTGDVAFLEADAASGRVPSGWAAAQVATSADFAHGSWFWTHFSGGLNYQVVHHLFPGVCHTHYPSIAPIVLHTCEEFEVPYKVYPSFWSALRAHFKHLKSVGAGSQRIPSLATVG